MTPVFNLFTFQTILGEDVHRVISIIPKQTQIAGWTVLNIFKKLICFVFKYWYVPWCLENCSYYANI